MNASEAVDVMSLAGFHGFEAQLRQETPSPANGYVVQVSGVVGGRAVYRVLIDCSRAVSFFAWVIAQRAS